MEARSKLGRRLEFQRRAKPRLIPKESREYLTKLENLKNRKKPRLHKNSKKSKGSKRCPAEKVLEKPKRNRLTKKRVLKLIPRKQPRNPWPTPRSQSK